MNDSPLPISDDGRKALADICLVAMQNKDELRFTLQRLSFHEIRHIIDGLTTAMLLWLDERGQPAKINPLYHPLSNALAALRYCETNVLSPNDVLRPKIESTITAANAALSATGRPTP